MQLTFPDGEHESVALRGEVTVGGRAGNVICLPAAGLAPLHASFLADRRGLWLRVPAGVKGVHVNARPVQRLALLRPGDLVCLDRLRVVIKGDDEPAIERGIPASAPPAMTDANRVSASRVILRGLSGVHFGRAYTLTEPRAIGRQSGADIRLDDPAVAEKHAVIELHGDRVVLRAAGKNATLVNGFPVVDAVLSPGDQIAIEQHRFVVEAPGLPGRGQEGDQRPAMPTHTQTIKAVKMPTPVSDRGAAPEPAPPRDPHSLWWLICAAFVLAVALTWLLLYAPRG
ncbi:FHA domain-containing protein [Arenimonas composti]|uniref:FHA domain-containing protein n=1 Tax=Arenimonas composti TR7-09 = DSM 18010 TaxID=1121013 RepID=A0A091AY74_9GAMM|nr:FHA domain-containing protein [Arenimonas composti]KFN45273.1 hypothetical protein P873_02300 [Arenimonas composti TR7-09 = DSM 18010]